MNYTSREVVRRLKQYDMFLNSLNLTVDEMQKERICDQLDKIEKQILLDTNSEYEEEYRSLINKETRYLEEEKSRLRAIVSLITSRRAYLEERKRKHKDVTGSLVELTTFLGEDNLTLFKDNLKIIEKYENNKQEAERIIREMKELDLKISTASRNVKSNSRMNDIMENKMISLVEKTINKLKLYSLNSKKEEILKKYDSLCYAMELAKDNLTSAKEINDDKMVLECDNMLTEITTEYSKYNEDVNIIRFMEIYDRPVNGYEELLKKREEIDSILKELTGSEVYKEVSEEINKEYNTIKLEGQDIKTYESLKEERNRKNKLLYDLEEENNSKEFKAVLEDLIRNENKYREEQILKARMQESREREKKIAEEQKIEAARVKRQKLIEEARLKDQMERTAKLKSLQDNTVLSKKKEEKDPIFNTEELKKPLKDKTFESVMESNDDFDTDELFENTKIVPNKVMPSLEEKIAPKEEFVPLQKEKEEKIELPLWGEIPTEDIKTETLFKEEPKIQNVEVKERNSIYDLLENNQNIIWSTTEEAKKENSIPVIGNNNLKPEIISGGSKFPELKDKEGDMLWKETL